MMTSDHPGEHSGKATLLCKNPCAFSGMGYRLTTPTKPVLKSGFDLAQIVKEAKRSSRVAHAKWRSLFRSALCYTECMFF